MESLQVFRCLIFTSSYNKSGLVKGRPQSMTTQAVIFRNFLGVHRLPPYQRDRGSRQVTGCCYVCTLSTGNSWKAQKGRKCRLRQPQLWMTLFRYRSMRDGTKSVHEGWDEISLLGLWGIKTKSIYEGSRRNQSIRVENSLNMLIF